MLLCLPVLTGLVSSCSLKKNTAASRNYTAFITRYNIYFNGDEHYKTTLATLEKDYADDYSRRLFMHPAEAHGDITAPKPSGDFKRSIEKAQKSIQLRSIKRRPARKPGKGNDPEYKAWLKREEYNPFLHNAWMMMARSQYMNGDFSGAASTFFYISKHFWWLPATVTEAKLWQARCYLAIDWLFEAESIMSLIHEKDLTSNKLRALYNFDWADYYMRSGRDTEAIPFLKLARQAAKGPQRTRLTFLLGQLYEQTGQRDSAYMAFKKVGSTSSASYRTRFNARIKQSEVFGGDDIAKEVKDLKSMARQSRNKEYLDQLYYAIGNLYLSRSDTTQAIDNYKLAVARSTRAGIDKAVAQMALGKLYFRQGRYDLAQPCYSEAIPLLPVTYPDYMRLKRESDVLDELAVYSQNVTLQDSLLELSKLPVEEQRKVAERLAEELKQREKKEAEDAAREAYLAEQEARGTGLNLGSSASSAPTAFVMNTDNSWYFYNEGTRNAGRTEFQRRWGNRRLEDDWRRRNKSVFGPLDSEEADLAAEENASADSMSAGDSGTTPESPESKADREAQLHLTDPHFPEYYLAQIPTDSAQRETSREVIKGGLYNMGIILKDKLENFGAAEREFKRLMTEFPDNPYRMEVLNNLFLMYLRQGNMSQAEHYRADLLREFPDSRFAEALRGDDYVTRLLQADSIQAVMYDRAFAAYMDNRNEEVHTIYARMRHDYPQGRIIPKFMFIDALAYVTENKPKEFSEVLTQLVDRYPDTDVAPLASDYLRYLSQGRKFHSTGSVNLRGMVWSARLTTDSASVSMSDRPAEFDFSDPQTPQYFVFLYPAASINGNALIYDVARFNFNSFTVRDFDIEPMTFGPLGLIVVKGFSSVADVDRYRSMLESSTLVKMPESVVPVAISEHNFDVLTSEGRSFEEYFEAIGDNRLRQTHEAVLPPDEYPSAREMYNPDPVNEEITTETDSATKSETAEEPTVVTTDKPQEDETEIEPAVEPAPQSTVEPVTQPEIRRPAPKPVPPAPQRKVQTPQRPVPPPPAPKPKPMPYYPEGSEGDDPLLDD